MDQAEPKSSGGQGTFPAWVRLGGMKKRSLGIAVVAVATAGLLAYGVQQASANTVTPTPVAPSTGLTHGVAPDPGPRAVQLTAPEGDSDGTAPNPGLPHGMAPDPGLTHGVAPNPKRPHRASGR